MSKDAGWVMVAGIARDILAGALKRLGEFPSCALFVVRRIVLRLCGGAEGESQHQPNEQETHCPPLRLLRGTLDPLATPAKARCSPGPKSPETESLTPNSRATEWSETGAIAFRSGIRENASGWNRRVRAAMSKGRERQVWSDPALRNIVAIGSRMAEAV
jgi:hypothetical protein